MAYATTAQAKAFLDISGSGDDSLIGDLIARAQAVIDEYVGFGFEASADADRYFNPLSQVDPEDRATLYLDRWLAQAPTTISNNNDGTPETIAAGERILIPRNEAPYYAIRLLDSSGKAWTYTNDPEAGVKIAGRWAWAVTAPNQIVHACVRLATLFYRQRGSQADLDRPLITGDGVTILPAQIPIDIRQILDRYKALSRFG